MKRTAWVVQTTLMLFFFGSLLMSPLALADEGMWLFTSPPVEQIKDRYGFTLTPNFLELLQKSSIRVSNGGSASFVSQNGLIMTNHHVAVSTLNKLSTPDNDLVKNGFYAASLADEIKCSEIEMIVLEKILDVTKTVKDSVTSEMTPTQAEEARRAIMNKIEQQGKTQLKCDQCNVVTLYEGGVYHLYCYKKLQDVRLVFAPEESVGFFGGEPDNFEYPRYNLDVAFFRAYENDKPYQPPFFLKWSAQGAAENELVFVSGHPGRTDRFKTIDHLAFQRDVEYPYLLNKLRRREVMLQIFSEKSQANAQLVASELFGIRNSRKNRTGVLLGLQNPVLYAQKYQSDEQLYNQIVEKKLLDLEKDSPWDKVNSALNLWEEIYIPYDLFEKGQGFNCQTYQIARNIVRYVTEMEKPNEQRLREFQDASAESIKMAILSKQPINNELEQIKLTDSMGMYLEYFMANEYPSQDDPGLGLLNGKSPKDRAAELIRGTKLQEPAERQKLLDGGTKGLAESKDAMIQLALKMDPYSRELRAAYDNMVAEPLRQAYAQIAQARFELSNAENLQNYPDATFTLRLSYGKVLGYQDENGQKIPAWTTIQGAFDHAAQHQFVDPYDLPESWTSNQAQVNLKTPLNLVTTNDIIGGNSGSPLINQKGEVVGLIFDGNVESLVSNFIYTEDQARAVSVHSAAIPEALRKIYHADRIADELTPAK